MKKITILIDLVLLASCNGMGNDVIAPHSSVDGFTTSDININTSETEDDDDMRLVINNREIEVEWENNASVEQLKTLLPLDIQTTLYGGFEQVGHLPQDIVSLDSRIETKPGDIMLYNQNQITFFFGSNTWSYTPLGRIVNLSNEEITSLLNVTSLTISLLK